MMLIAGLVVMITVPDHGAPAQAQVYPSATIKLIVPGGPGGPAELAARFAADAIAKLGQPVVVEPRAGAGGAIAARDVAKAAPDGHTLLVGSTAILAILPLTQANAGYDATSFVPIAKLWETTQALVVSPSSTARDWRQFKALSKDGALTYGHAGTGGLPHLAFELFRKQAGIEMTGVAFRGDADAINAILSGSVQAAMPSVSVALPLIASGQLRALGVSSQQRLRQAPNLPTLAEQGLADFAVSAFFGIVAPPGTPAPIVATLNQVLVDALRAPQSEALFATWLVSPTPGSPTDFTDFLQQVRPRWADAVAAAGLGAVR
jgi:tripartite-type tricarboxylate transporter receptor subunit TctC